MITTGVKDFRTFKKIDDKDMFDMSVRFVNKKFKNRIKIKIRC